MANLKQVKRLIQEQISRLQNPGRTPNKQTRSAPKWKAAIPRLMEEFGPPSPRPPASPLFIFC